MGRTSGSFIKDLRYDKFYVINYRYRGEINVLCNLVVDGIEYEAFVPIPDKFSERNSIGVVKYFTEEEAKNILTNLSDIVINGYEMELEISYSAYEDFLIGV